MPFDEAIALDIHSPTEATWQVPDGWQQGRGAFGGLVLAALARAARSAVDAPDRLLRTLTGEIPGAVLVGPARVKVTPLRDGQSLSTVAAELSQDDGVVAHAVFNFGRARNIPFDLDRRESLPHSFADVPVASAESPFAPTFSQHFEYRLLRGMPLSGDQAAVTEGWVRLRRPGEVAPWLALVALLDAWFPSVLPAFTSPRPVGTISFAAHFFERAWQPDAPLFHRSRMLGTQDGYFAELRELFTPSGELCAINQQTMAIIK